jgi:hypothetical protein
VPHRADAAAKGDDRAAQLPSVVSAANDIISVINTTEMAAFLAMRAPADDADGSNGSNGGGSGGSSGGSSAAEVYKETKGEKEKEKAALLEALRVKLKAQLDLAEVCLRVVLVSYRRSPSSRMRMQGVGDIQLNTADRRHGELWTLVGVWVHVCRARLLKCKGRKALAALARASVALCLGSILAAKLFALPSYCQCHQ